MLPYGNVAPHEILLIKMVMIVSAVQTIACVLIVSTYIILRLVDEIRELKDRLEDGE